MTVTALLTHTSLVGFLVFMAGKAGGVGLLKLCTQVTGLAGGYTVNANQWKASDVMFEKELYIPALFVVAISTILAQLIFMNIDCPMTGDAVRLFETIHRHSAMTG